MRNNQKWENIPEELKKEGVFCLHENKTPKKLRDSKLFNASPNKKEDFSSFEEIMKDYKQIESDKTGIGIGIFDNVCGIDIDHCIDNQGNYSEEAKDIINTFNSYTEKSPSGTGIHILFRCENQLNFDTISKYYKKNDKKGLEIYQGQIDNRYLTITGNKVKGEYITIEPEVIQKFIDKYMKKESIVKKEETYQKTTSDDSKTDEEYFEIGLQKDSTLQTLWNETPSGSGGTESQTDFSLLSKIAYWTNNNESLMLRQFESSPYFAKKDTYHKEKWAKRKEYHLQRFWNQYDHSRTARGDNQTFNEKQQQIQEKKTQQEEEKKKRIEQFILKNAKQQFTSFCEKSSRGEFKPIPTGFTNLDEALSGGFLKQSIINIGGGSSVGKTSIATNIALQLLKQNQNVIYYTLEMSEEQILSKIYSNIAFTTQTKESRGIRIESNDFFKMYDENVFTETRKRLVAEAIEQRTELEKLHIINESSDLDEMIEHTNQLLEYFKNQNEEAPILFVDYLQFIRGKSREDVQATIKRATKFFKDYAIKNNTIVVVLTANNRTSTEEKTKSSFSGGRDSSDIEYSFDYNLQINFAEWELQDSKFNKDDLKDRVTLINQEEKYMTLTIHKLRMGRGGGIAVFKYIGKTNTFEPLSMEEYYSQLTQKKSNYTKF